MKLKVAAALDAVWRLIAWLWEKEIIFGWMLITGLWAFFTLMIWGSVESAFWVVFGPSLMIYSGLIVVVLLALAIYGFLRWGHQTMDSVRRDERNWHK